MFSFLQKKIQPNLSFLGADMHSHLLPGIDDGLATVEQTLSFAKELQQMGYQKLICTPHILQGVYDNTPQTVREALALAQKTLQQNNIDITLEAAAEYMVDEQLEAYIKNGGELLTFGKQNYMLIELSYVAASPNLFQVIFDIKVKDIQPIFAHPERYEYLHFNFNKYIDIKDRGIYFQVNLLSLAGYYGPRVKAMALRLMKENMVEFIGTDMHHEIHLEATKAFTSSKAFYKLMDSQSWMNASLL